MMDSTLEFLRSNGAVIEIAGDGPVVQRFDDVAAEYRAVSEGCALFPHTRRGLIQVTGKDRAAWLHNLCTQNIKVLKPGDGCYAFALNVKGRILFDMTVWADVDALWLDVDRRFLPFAMKHLTKYTVTEDVALKDGSDGFSRWVVLGPLGKEMLNRIGPSHLGSMAHWQHCSALLNATEVRFIRNDAYGPFAVELNVPAEQADKIIPWLTEQGMAHKLRWVGMEALEIRRIESGIPWPVADLFDDILPAETRQLERAVNYQKGCYLGQEIVERMRSRGGLSRSLVGLAFDAPPPMPTAEHRPALLRADHPTGFLTSAVYSNSQNQWIGLGYVKLSDANPGSELSITADTGVVRTTVHALPFRAPV